MQTSSVHTIPAKKVGVEETMLSIVDTTVPCWSFAGTPCRPRKLLFTTRSALLYGQTFLRKLLVKSAGQVLLVQESSVKLDVRKPPCVL